VRAARLGVRRRARAKRPQPAPFRTNYRSLSRRSLDVNVQGLAGDPAAPGECGLWHQQRHGAAISFILGRSGAPGGLPASPPGRRCVVEFYASDARAPIGPR
jgi:hypothetical protein